MKDFIVLCAILPILLVLILAHGLIVKNTAIEQDVREYVYSSVQAAKQDGRFSDENIDNLKEKIAARTGLEEDEVIIEADSVPKYRVNEFNDLELIHYRVEVPIKKIIPVNITGVPNRKLLIIEQDVASERLIP